MGDFHVGFSGSSERVTPAQAISAARVFRQLSEEWVHRDLTLHHGDCVQADARAHKMAQRLGWRIEIHPPICPTKRAFCEGADVVHEPRGYMERNTDIARLASVLVALPDERDEIIRSGTWSTVRRARKYGRRILIVQPDGIVREDQTRAAQMALV